MSFVGSLVVVVLLIVFYQVLGSSGCEISMFVDDSDRLTPRVCRPDPLLPVASRCFMGFRVLLRSYAAAAAVRMLYAFLGHLSLALRAVAVQPMCKIAR